MRYTETLGLPIYDNPETDLFKINEWNNGNLNIDNKIKEFILSLKYIAIDIKSLGCKCDGVTNDSLNFKNALENKSNVTINIYDNCVIDDIIEIGGLINVNINIIGTLDIRKKLIFNNCNNININIMGKIKGYSLKYSTITDLGVNTITVDDITPFKQTWNDDKNIICPKNFNVLESKYFGVLNNVTGNTLNVSDNTILPNFSSLSVGDKLYSCVTSFIVFNNSNDIKIKGYVEPLLTMHICNNVDLDVTQKYGGTSIQFCYNVSIKSISDMARFYGLFLMNSRKINIISFNSTKALFTALCIKSCHDVNQGNIQIEKPCLMAQQVIRNTNTDSATPSGVNPNCQSDLKCNNINIETIIFKDVRQGLRINKDSYNLNVGNLISYNSIGNQIIVQDDEKLISGINIGNINIENHEQQDGTKYNGSIPIYLDGVNNCNINNINIKNTKPKQPLRIENSDNVNINNFNLNNFIGSSEITNCTNISLGEIKANTTLSSSLTLLLISNLNGFTIKNIFAKDDNIFRGINGTGTLENGLIDNINLKNTNRLSNSRGVYLVATSVNNVDIVNCDIVNFNDNLTMSNAYNCKVNNNTIKGANNSIAVSGTSDNIVSVGNMIESKASTNINATNKLENNLRVVGV